MKSKHMRVIAVFLALSSPAAFAENFIALGQPGPPGKFALLSFQNFINGPKDSVFPVHFVLITPSYYTTRGFTKTRDSFQLYAGAAVGYANAPQADVKTIDRFGWGLPHVGIQWYFNAVRPTPISNAPGAAKFTWYFSPYITAFFPNGATTSHGFAGIFGNNIRFSIGLQNSFTIGGFALTVMPVQVNYTGPYLHNLSKTQEQLDIDIMDLGMGYAIHPTLFVGIHHVYSLKNVSGSSVIQAGASQWGEGRIGPSATYVGFASKGLFLFANINFTYITGNPIYSPKTTSVNSGFLYVF